MSLPEIESTVRGERGAPTIARRLSVQSRVTNMLAAALMLAIGGVFIVWYYLHSVTRARPAGAAVRAVATEQARAEMPLPSLGKLDSLAIQDLPSQTQWPVNAPILQSAAVPLLNPQPNLPAQPQPTQPSALERRLSGAAFAVAGASTVASAGVASAATVANAVADTAAFSGAKAGDLADLLNASSPRTVAARLLPSQRLLLPKGAFIDCTLETAIDSTLPGLTTCITATDTFGADGTVVLLERGTKLIGETRGQVQQASSRVFVLWDEARTPGGVVVPLESPGTDELGRSGLPGEVERHFWQRFGAAILISTLNGTVQAAVQSGSRGNGTVIYNPSGPQDVVGEVLKSTLSTAPTVIKQNGDRIQVLVARDVDFGSVYELRHTLDRP